MSVQPSALQITAQIVIVIISINLWRLVLSILGSFSSLKWSAIVILGLSFITLGINLFEDYKG